MRETETTNSILWKADSIFFVNCNRREFLIIFWRKNYQTALFSPLADFLTIIDPTSREVTEIFPNMRNKLVPSFFELVTAAGQPSVQLYCLQIMITPELWKHSTDQPAFAGMQKGLLSCPTLKHALHFQN